MPNLERPQLATHLHRDLQLQQRKHELKYRLNSAKGNLKSILHCLDYKHPNSPWDVFPQLDKHSRGWKQ